MSMKRAMMSAKVIYGIFISFLIVIHGWAEPLVNLQEVISLEEKIEQTSAKVLPTVVALISEQTGASGSGVVVEENGLILTAAHVVDGAEEVDVVFPDGKQARGKVVGANYSKDIGMVKILDKGKWPAAKIGDSKELKAGSWVIAMGHSEGFDPARTPPVRFGRVVSLGPGNFLTTDCTLIGGDSGGPLFDLEGRVVGINSSIGNDLNNNNHAGIAGFKEDWDRLIAGESWGELQLNPLANPERPVMGIMMGRSLPSGGVPVERVTPESPAAIAGIRTGDIIVALGEHKVRGGQSLGMLLAKHSGGDEVELTLLRGREEIQLVVKLIRQDQLFEMLGR